MTYWKMKLNAKTSCCYGIDIWIQQNVSINPLFYGNMVVINELKDKIMCCISKLQIDRDFWPVLYLKHEVQEYNT